LQHYKIGHQVCCGLKGETGHCKGWLSIINGLRICRDQPGRSLVKPKGVRLMRIKLVLLSLLTIFSLILSVVFTLTPTGAQAPGDWTEYSSNPVFGQWIGGAKAYYPKVIYDANQFSGHGNSAYYKMWFQSSSGIGYASSNDGIIWTAGTNPLGGLVAGASHPLVKYDLNGFGGGIYYKIWYWAGSDIYIINALRYAESADGITWTNDQPFTQDGSSPLVTGHWPDWNTGTYGPCDIIYNQNGSNSPDDGNLWNNKYVLYYMGTDGDHEYIGLAYSNNAIHWKRYGNNAVLGPGAPADWDNYSVGYCRVMKISGSWHMWYGGGPGTNLGIGYATSPDGVNWIKHPGNPIFYISDGMPWRNNRTYTPWVLYDAASFGGHGDACYFKMWFTGRSTDGKYSIGYTSAIPAATVTAVNPASGMQGQCPMTVIITGTNFNGATAISFGTGITVSRFTVNSATRITATICITSDAALGAHDVAVTTHGGPGMLRNSFTVNASPLNRQIGTGAPTSHGSFVGSQGTYGYSPPVTLPAIVVQSASLSAKTVTPGTPVTVTANIANKSTVNGNKKVTLYVNGQVEAEQGVSVNSGGSSRLTFNVSRNEPGDYNVYVDGVLAGNFKVELFRESDAILIFSTTLVALAFLLGMVILWRRKTAGY